MSKKRQSKINRDIIQKKLSFFLRKYREKNNISSKEMAYRLGYTPSRYCKIESETIPYERFINSIQILRTFAELEDMTIHDFISYIDGEFPKKRLETIRTWEGEIVDTFRKLKMNLRRDFIEALPITTRKEKLLLEKALELFLTIKKKGKEEYLDALITIIENTKL